MVLVIIKGLFSIFSLLLIAYLVSANRKKINWRTAGGALVVQMSLGAFVLYFPLGKTILWGLSAGVQKVIDNAQDGINFLFGNLATDAMLDLGVGFIFAVRVLPIIIFFSSLIAVFYYLGIAQWVIRIIGGGLQKALQTSKVESMSATANVFVGQTEAPLVVRPFIKKTTESELFAIMVGGLATVAGSVMVGYASLGVDLQYLIAASFMAAPGGLLMAKMIVPEIQTEFQEIKVDLKDGEADKPANVIDAAAAGASSGLKLAANVGAMLLAFIAIIALLNMVVQYIGTLFGFENITIDLLLGYIFAPLAFLVGVAGNEILEAGNLIGKKLILNEFVAYVNFVEIKSTLSQNTQAIMTFALCGFANFSSIAILIGGIGGMAPERRSDIARLGLKAVMAATLANLMSATIAGFFLRL